MLPGPWHERAEPSMLPGCLPSWVPARLEACPRALPSLNLASRPSDPPRGPGSLAERSDCELLSEKQAAHLLSLQGGFGGFQASDALGPVSLHRKQPEWPVSQARNPVSSLQPVLLLINAGDSLFELFVHVSSLDDRCGFLRGFPTSDLSPTLVCLCMQAFENSDPSCTLHPSESPTAPPRMGFRSLRYFSSLGMGGHGPSLLTVLFLGPGTFSQLSPRLGATYASGFSPGIAPRRHVSGPSSVVPMACAPTFSWSLLPRPAQPCFMPLCPQILRPDLGQAAAREMGTVGVLDRPLGRLD